MASSKVKVETKATAAAAKKVEEAGKTLKAAETKAVEAVAKVVEAKTAEKAESAEEKKTEKVTDTVKKAVKKVTTAKKEKAEKAPATVTGAEVYVQFSGNEAGVIDVVAKAKEAFAAEGHKTTAIKNIRIYLKPEENAAYYVVNEKFAGKVELF